MTHLLEQVSKDKVKVVRSPLRICPLGAHIDHQDGLVTGMALQETIDLMYAPSEDSYIRVQSMDFPDTEYFHLERVPEMIPGFWGTYLRGAVLALSQRYKLKRGIIGNIRGKLPIGGLSSSAAVTTAYLLALCDVNEIDVSQKELIQLSHWVERHFIGLQNGILDQSANILSKANHLMLMDCETGKYQLIEASSNMPEFEVVIVYSGLSTSLISTDYNNRVDECRVAAWLLKECANERLSPLQEMKLRQVDEEIYEKYKDRLPGRFRRRAEHFFSEMERVQQGVKAWSAGDLEQFGQLMKQSGQSSVHLYECGCPELITIFNLLLEAPGVYGARFSGAGYRGCCIGLIDPDYKEEIVSLIDAEYPVRHPEYKDKYQVSFSKIGDGARIESGADLQ